MGDLPDGSTGPVSYPALARGPSSSASTDDAGRGNQTGDSGAGAPYPPWGWRQVLVGLSIAVVSLVLLITIVAFVVAPSRGAASTVHDLVVGLVATIALELSLFGIAAGLTAGQYPGGLRLLGWRAASLTRWIGWSLLGVVLAWISIGVYAGVINALGLKDIAPKNNVPNGIFDHRQTVALAVFLTVIAAPVVEETFFRGFVFNGLRRTLGFSGAATVSGLLFALAHASPTLIVPFTVIGVIFAYLYRRTGTLWTNVTTHALFNLATVLLALLTGGSRR